MTLLSLLLMLVSGLIVVSKIGIASLIGLRMAAGIIFRDPDRRNIKHHLAVTDGEMAIFVGPPRCGKSTLLRMIAGLEDASYGKIYLDGEEVTDKVPSERALSMVFQSYTLYPHMDVAENAGFDLKTAGLGKDEIAAKVAKASAILDLDGYFHRRPKDLSGGQRQRVAIGRAIVREPKGFLLDEPLSNLNAALRVQMRFEIAKLHENLKSTMIYVTHDQVEAMTLADKIVVLRDGRVEQVGAPRADFNWKAIKPSDAR